MRVISDDFLTKKNFPHFEYVSLMLGFLGRLGLGGSGSRSGCSRERKTSSTIIRKVRLSATACNYAGSRIVVLRYTGRVAFSFTIRSELVDVIVLLESAEVAMEDPNDGFFDVVLQRVEDAMLELFDFVVDALSDTGLEGYTDVR